MEKISMTCFVDFVLKAGTPKLSAVRDIKETRDEAFSDFYKPLREAMLDMHREGETIASVDHFLSSLEDERKKRIYPPIVRGYEKFLASGRMRWFEPPTGSVKMGGITLNINPELGLEIDGTPHLIKLYFRGDPLSAKRVSVILNLMTQSGLAQRVPGCVFAVLDVRKARLHPLKAANPRLNLLLRGEAASFSAIYAAL
jgi:hypothetical protein